MIMRLRAVTTAPAMMRMGLSDTLAVDFLKIAGQVA